MTESNEETAEHGSASILGAERKEEKFHWGQCSMSRAWARTDPKLLFLY